jgi:hypothetical protein
MVVHPCPVVASFGSRALQRFRSQVVPPATPDTIERVHIVSALFVENFALRQAPGPSTRIDITGVMFSMAAPSPVPVTIDPHLVALLYCPPANSGSGVFEVVFRRGLELPSETTPGDPAPDDQIARNVSPFTVDPGKFTYRLVKAELEFPEYGQIFAHCRIDRGPWLSVPFTLLPPAP